MRKEALVAILIGLTLGLVITYGVYQAQQTITKPAAPPKVETELTPTPGMADPESLSLHSPQDQIVQAEPTTAVTGTTLPNSYVVIFINDDEVITTADGSGNFSIDAKLETGSNIIMVYTLNEDGEVSQTERTVIVSKEFADQPADNSADDETETDADSDVSNQPTKVPQ